MAKTRDGRDVVTIFSDASFCHANQVGGWGFWMRTDTVVRRGGGPLFDVVSSTQAEMWAVAKSLLFALEEGLIPRRARVVFGVDNQWVVDTMAGRLKFEKGNKDHPCYTPYMMVQEVRKKWEVDVRCRKVKAHDSKADRRGYVNEVADQMAKAGLRYAREVIK